MLFLAAVLILLPADAFGLLRQNGKIAFVSTRDGNAEIYVMDADGSRQTRLTFNATPDRTPTWSPNGRTIAFVRGQVGSVSIWLMNADGSEQRPVPNTLTPSLEGLSWSPDGQRLAFSTGTQIETLAVDGTARTHLMPNNDTPATGPTWSPDGGTIAFAQPGGGAYSNIFGIPAGGGAVYQITQAYTYTVPNAPDWSPTGNRLIYAGASQDITNNECIRVVFPATFTDQPLYIDPNYSDIFTPKWSPDETRVVFSNAAQLFSVKVNGTDLRPLTIDSYSNSEPDWQPLPSTPVADFDGDGRSDLSVWRPSNGTWFQSQTTAGFHAMTWGVASDKLVPADYDGDGRTDIAIWRPSTGIWYLVMSASGTFITRSWGEPGDVPAPADFDGDGKAELSVFRPSTGIWYRIQSTNGHFVAIPYGESGDRPVVSDYDGDGRADLAVFRPSNGRWYVQRTTAGYTVVALGSATSPLAPADYDGDGRTEIAIISPSTGFWYIYDWDTASLSILIEDQFQTGDVPVPADYDGDGMANFAVFRPSTATWLIGSAAGISQTQFGVAGDVPTNNLTAYAMP